MNPVLEFIKRRFAIDCHWLDGNCYYFALILKDRFKSGKIMYDVIKGHFIFLYDGKYYDWTGVIEPDGHLVEWDKMAEYDILVKQRVIEGCLE